MQAQVPFLRAIGRFKPWFCAGTIGTSSSSSTNGTLRLVTRIETKREEELPEAFREPLPKALG